MKKIRKNFIVSVLSLVAFILWTVAVGVVDLQAIGPNGSVVGFGTVNGFVHSITGVNFGLYNLTDWLGLVPVFVCLGFGALGLIQLIKRKSIRKVDFDLLALGGFYILTIAVYLLFENVVINYRPVLINGVLEVSYPSSTTLLVTCVMPTAAMQFNGRIKNKVLCNTIVALTVLFTAFMVIGRLFSGVHWFSDIVGGGLISFALVMAYYSVSSVLIHKIKRTD